MHTLRLTPEELEFLVRIIENAKFDNLEEHDLLTDISDKLEEAREVW